MPESQSLIDFTALSEPAVKLLAVVSDAIGTLYEPTRIRRKAQAEADAMLTKAAVQLKLTALERRAAERVLRRESARQTNIESIVGQSLKFLPASSSSNMKPDPDWVAAFFDLCQDCSDAMLCSLWARLLAGEVDRPGTYSRRTLGAIKLLSVEEANLFTAFAACVWHFSESSAGASKFLIMDMDEKGRYSDATWGFDGALISRLEHIDLAEHEFFDLDERKRYNLAFHGRKHRLKPPSSAERLEIVSLSPVGEEIFTICGAEPNMEYYRTTLDYLKSRGLLIQ
jgi:hypothetical protein